MNTYETINLNDYVQTGEGGTSLTYTHKTRPTMAKLFNLANEAELAEREFLTARAVFEMGIPTPEPDRRGSPRRGVRTHKQQALVYAHHLAGAGKTGGDFAGIRPHGAGTAH